MFNQEDITQPIAGLTPFPEPETVFSPDQPWLAKHFLPLISIDLGLLRSELADTVVHLVNPFESYEGMIGEHTAEFHTPYVGENWLAFRLDEHNRYHFLADEGYFLRSQVHGDTFAEILGEDEEEDFAESLANYQTTQAHYQATGEFNPQKYPIFRNFIDQLGGVCRFANWTNTEPPAAYEMRVKDDLDEDDPEGNVFISHNGKPFFQVAAVPAYNYGCHGADWVILFYEPESRIALITFDWS